MMRLTWKDGLATLSVGAAVVLYALWVTETAMTGISTRALGVIVLGLGFVACTSASAVMAEVYGADASRTPTDDVRGHRIAHRVRGARWSS